MWLARVKLTDEKGPAEGDRVTLRIGPLSLVGTVLNSGVHGGQATARVVGGAGGWRQAPTGLSFQNDGNLSQADIAKALASSVGETIEAPARTIGVHWTFDPLASAGSNLDSLGSWYMRNDGVTVLGTRPDLGEFDAVVSEFEGMEGRASCLIEEYQADKFMPGALITSRSMDNAIRVKHARFLYAPKSFIVEVSSAEQKPNRLAEHAAGRARFFGTHLYRIIEQITDPVFGDRLQLQAVDGVRGIPDQVLVNKAHGIPGVLSDCDPSGECLVVFANGDTSKPFVTAYLGTSTRTYMTSRTVDQNVMLAPTLCQLLGAGGGAQAIVLLLGMVNVVAPGTFTPEQIAQATAAAAKFAVPDQPGVQTDKLRAPPIA
jgi:hypothetical protein